ncbi:hypothetical protein [Xylanimonas protaetiae]|uniref:Lactococcin 972 family bacteriocin n=1 Tax=Xylanimonas protaetiae TaxID=2509457 RepID=A0A4P6F7I0_9MICO|nr:hypothetical protein [Xylanimonas protaetiae]QAY71406.1 hypothetical protein ET471_16350 [Xylanimonas protaetiae]
MKSPIMRGETVRRGGVAAAVLAFVAAAARVFAAPASAAGWAIDSPLNCSSGLTVHLFSWTTNSSAVVHEYDGHTQNFSRPSTGNYVNTSLTGSQTNNSASVGASGTFTNNRQPERQCHGV